MPFAPSFQLRQMLSNTEPFADGPFSDADIPASPPEEVLVAIARAAEAWHALEASGRRVSFSLAPGEGLRSCLQDADGKLVTVLSPRQVLELTAESGI